MFGHPLCVWPTWSNAFYGHFCLTGATQPHIIQSCSKSFPALKTALLTFPKNPRMSSSFGFSTVPSSSPFSAPRRGPPPLPIRIANGAPSHVGTSSVTTDKANHHHRPATPHQSPATLLYELPPSSPRSPQLPPSSKNRSRSPPHSSSSRPDNSRTSFGSALQSHPRQGSNNGLSDTLNSGNIPRSLRPKSRQSSLNDPLEPKQEDLDAFVDLCQKWWFCCTPLFSARICILNTNAFSFSLPLFFLFSQQQVLWSGWTIRTPNVPNSFQHCTRS